MIIDWFTVAAQVVNFLVLVWLLKRFLYRPVLDAIDARERRIAGQVEHAARELDAAGAQHRDFEQKSRDLQAQRGALLEAAQQAAEQERSSILARAREEHDGLRRKLAAELGEQSAALVQRLAGRAMDEIIAVTRRVLADLADAELEDRIVATFLRRLRALSDADRVKLRAASRFELRSSFELSEERRARIAGELRHLAEIEVPLNAIRDPGLVAGIELATEGYCLRWSIEDYLLSLREALAQTLSRDA